MENNELFKELGKDFEESAIQRTKKEQTKKGYDTTGYGYQYIVDRLNDVLQDKWGFEWHIINTIEGKYSSGAPFWEITVRMEMWIIDKKNSRCCVGGHTSMTYHDALKGAITNAIKKTAAFFGVGSKAFRGELDDDNKSLPESHEQKTSVASNVSRLDFNEVKAKTEGMNEAELAKYQEEIVTKYRLTDKQKFWITNHFEQRFSAFNNPLNGIV